MRTGNGVSLAPSRAPWLRVVIVVGVLIVAITELLSAFRLIATVPMILAWGLAAAGALLWHHRRGGRLVLTRGEPFSVRGVPPAWWAVATVLAVTFLIGLAAPPNAWDGMTYHLPRVERWVEQGHLGFWPTSVDRQLWVVPFGSYAILQLRLLTGGDTLAFLPSWLACLGCILLTARLVRFLGGHPGHAAFGALLMATIPVAVLHASSVQTDLVTAFWMLAVVSLVVECWSGAARAPLRPHAMLLAFAVSLALLSKTTAAIALLPWLLLYAMALIRAKGVGALWGPLVLGSVAVLLLNGPHLARSFSLYGRQLSDPWVATWLPLGSWHPADMLSNLLSNLALHFGLPWEGWNQGVTNAVLAVQRSVLRVDPEALFPTFGGFRVHPFKPHESEAGAPVLLLALGGTLAFAVVRRSRPEIAKLAPMLLAGLAAFTLHLVTVRWQPFGARLQLGSLIWLPAVLAMIWTRPSRRAVLGGAVVLWAVPSLVFGIPRSLLGGHSVFTLSSSRQMALERPDHFRAAELAVFVAVESGCSRVGLVTGYDHPEYFLTSVARREGVTIRRDYINPWGPPARLAPEGIPADVCVILMADPIPGWERPEFDQQFRVVRSWQSYAVLRRTTERDR